METKLKEQLKEDILNRYDNEQYWDEEIIEQYELENKKEPEFYPCVWVGKEDLTNSEVLTEKEIDNLTEEDMKTLATELGDYLIGDNYSDGLRHAVERLKVINRINKLK